MNLKTILSVGTLAATGFLVFGKNKYSEYKSLMDNITFDIKGIKNVSFNREINFNVDLMITNPTSTAIDIPGNNLVVKKLHFYTLSGKKIGEANPNISDINIPANNQRLITNIPVSLSLSEIGNNLSEILEIVSDKNKLSISAEIEAFGKKFTVKA